MAKNFINNIGIFWLFIFNCNTVLAQDNLSRDKNQYRQLVLNEAIKDIGKVEGINNGGFTKKYHVDFYEFHRYKLNLGSAYCGIGLFSWYYRAGLNPNIKTPERALSWFNNCKHPISATGLTIDNIVKIKPATATIFKLDYGYHVGLFEGFKNFEYFHIEANTSNRRSVIYDRKYKQGVFRTHTKTRSKGIRVFGFCDCVDQSTIILKK